LYYENNKSKILEKRKMSLRSTCEEKRRYIESGTKSNSNKNIHIPASDQNDSQERKINIQGEGFDQNLKKNHV
jgi:hypothetical protein